MGRRARDGHARSRLTGDPGRGSGLKLFRGKGPEAAPSLKNSERTKDGTMSTTTTLLVALLIYVGAAAYAYRSAYFGWRERRGPRHTTLADVPHVAEPVTNNPLMRAIGIVLLVVLGGVMVLAGTALVLDSGNVSHGLPYTGHEFVQLMKDTIPGMISVVVGFLLLEATNRTLGGKGIRHG